jgi:malate dehydrogenase (oxaloacetate-decarboxylating)(NADP+)
MSDKKQESLRQAALSYHEFPKPGKLEIRATKPMANGRDLARAYSPGVAEASIEIRDNPETASKYTARAIWLRLFQTDLPFWDWATLVRWRQNP